MAADVDKAVKAAHKAYHEGDWGRMSARERGSLLFKLGKVANKLSKSNQFINLQNITLNNFNSS